MLNPDGVINGNNRTSLCGHDLNRNWRCPDPKRHPTIYHTKELISNLINKTEHKVVLYLDLHGHSRQKVSITYPTIITKINFFTLTTIVSCLLRVSLLMVVYLIKTIFKYVISPFYLFFII
jgi:hypothetical protein